jgi:hypothetical protein
MNGRTWGVLVLIALILVDIVSGSKTRSHRKCACEPIAMKYTTASFQAR